MNAQTTPQTEPPDQALAAHLKAKTPMVEIAAWLDGLDHPTRLRIVRALGPKDLKELYTSAQGRHCELDFFVPPSVAPGAEVIHHGINSLPVIGGTFRKRMCRDPERADLLWGYNDNDGVVRHLGWFTGPGYFAVRPRGCENPDGRKDSDQLFINYYERPPEAPIAGWPTPKPPLGPTAALVFGEMCDYMWAVSQHISIGAAFKKGAAVGQYFALVRQDEAPNAT